MDEELVRAERTAQALEAALAGATLLSWSMPLTPPGYPAGCRGWSEHL